MCDWDHEGEDLDADDSAILCIFWAICIGAIIASIWYILIT